MTFMTPGMHRSVLVAAVTAVMGVCGLGCSRPGTAPTVPAAGTLLRDDTPLGDVTVVFNPASGRPAMGVTDAAGRFVLSTFRRGDGAIAGNHRVTLAVMDPGRPEPGTPESRSYRPKPVPFAARYGAIATTDLEVSLPSTGSTSLILRVAP